MTQYHKVCSKHCYSFVWPVFIYPHSVCFFSFLPLSLYLLLGSFSFSRKTLNSLFNTSALVEHSLTFHLSENVFVSPLLLKDILAGHKILGWQKSTVSTLKIWFYCLPAFIGSFEGNRAFFYGCF